jgi:hypothetical protein
MRPIRPIGPIGLILLLAFAATALAADVTWDTVIPITRDSASQVTGYSGQRSVAADAAGNVYVVWQDQRDVPYQAWGRRYDAGTSTWQAETALTTRQANCFQPSLACDSAGNLHLAWHIGSSMGTGIWAKRYNVTTHHWRADTLIDSTTTSYPQQYPSVACALGTGDAAVGWYGSPDTGMYYQVFLRERHPATGWDSAMQVSLAATNHDQVSVAAGSDGDLAVVWVGKDFGDDSYDQVYCRRRVGTDWQGVERVSDMPLAWRQYAPSVAFDPGGAVHVVWHGRTLSSSYYQVFYRMRDAGGWSEIDSIGGTRPYQQQFASIACDGGGRCHAVWCSQGGGTNFQLVYAQRDTDGVWSSPTILTSLDSGTVRYPSVACGVDSSIHIVWSDDHSGNPDVYYLRGFISGSSAVEESRSGPRPACEHAVARAGSSKQLPGTRWFDACGRVSTGREPGVYFVRADKGGLRRLIVVR